jgi:hypothetical protein
MRRQFALAFAALGIVAGGAIAASALALRSRARPGEPPSVFAVHVVELIAANRYDEAWLDLHPVHQRVAPRYEYVGCESQSPIPGHLASVRVVRTFDDPAAMGRGRMVPSTAVVVRITLAQESQRVVVTDTVHAVRVGHRWAWVLPAWRLEDYRAGVCPDGGAGPGNGLIA